MKRRDPDGLPAELTDRPDPDDPTYAEWLRRRKVWAVERGESVGMVIIEERLRRARHRAGRSS